MTRREVSQFANALLKILNADENVKVAYSSRSLKTLATRLSAQLPATGPVDERIAFLADHGKVIFDALVQYARERESTFWFQGREFVLIQETIAAGFLSPPVVIPG
ncbi:MAG TPA: hypothetical protein VF432_10805 [Thermoanaerobaculia bacterium]